MIAYGVQYRAYLELRLRERERESEATGCHWSDSAPRTPSAPSTRRKRSSPRSATSFGRRSTAAIGNIDLARRTSTAARSTACHSALTAARGALSRLTRLTDDLVEASRGTAPRVKPEPIDAGDVLTPGLRLGAAAGRREGRRRWSARSATASRSVADADALLAVFSNLLSNAIRYTPAGGRVEARCEANRAGGLVQRDATPASGMPAEVRDHIFERFYRSPEAKRAEPRGLGLGLVDRAAAGAGARGSASRWRAGPVRAARSGSGCRVNRTTASGGLRGAQRRGEMTEAS